jgi:uncharacterized protein YkwD
VITLCNADHFRVMKRLLLVGVVALLAGTSSALAGPRSARRTSIQTLDAGVLVQLNAIRRAHHLVPLKLNSALSAAAMGHSSEMVTDGYFAHNSFNGAPFWKRLLSYGGSHGWSVGENLLWSAPTVDPASALRMWMASPEHRKNILTPGWREIGIAAVHVQSAPGTFGGQAVTVITTDFGVRH